MAPSSSGELTIDRPGMWGTPEAELILRAASVHRPGVSDLLETELDWPRVIGLAKRHRMLPLLTRSVTGAGWSSVPEAVATALSRYRVELAARNLFMATELLRLLALLERAGIEALPLKGPALAMAAYGDLALRPFGDLDILVAENDAARAKQVLVAEGFRANTPRSDELGVELHPLEYAFALEGDGDLAVEIHWRLVTWLPLALHEVLPSSGRVPLLRGTVRDLSPEFSVLVQCVHGTKHDWSRLEWVCALAHTIARSPDLDWDTLRGEADGRGVLRSLGLGLALAERLAGAPVPATLLEPPVVSDRTRAVSESLCEAMFQVDEPATDLVDAVRGQLQNRGARSRLRYVAGLSHPNERDLAFVRLPPRVAFLYYAVRPVRLVFEHTRLRNLPARLEDERRARAARAMADELDQRAQTARGMRGHEEAVVAELASRWRRRRRTIEKRLPLPAHPRVLDVGSGAFSPIFGSEGWRAVGVDPLACQYATMFPTWQRSVPTMAGVGEQLPFRDGAFDLVLCHSVVDQVARPGAILAELVRVLRPGGSLHVTIAVHHPLYSTVAWAHAALRAAGIGLAARSFASLPRYLSRRQAELLFAGLALRNVQVDVGVAAARDRARARRPRRARDVLALIAFTSARMTVVAERVD